MRNFCEKSHDKASGGRPTPFSKGRRALLGGMAASWAGFIERWQHVAAPFYLIRLCGDPNAMQA